MSDVRIPPNSDGTPPPQLEELGNMGFALAMQLVRDRHDAADAVQDSLRSLWRHRGKFDPNRGKLRAWFLKIVRNRCLDLLRRRARQSARTVKPDDVSAPPEERPDIVAQQRELLDLLKEELMAMPHDQMEVILLRDYHNLSYWEMARVLTIPVGTVMSRLHRARTALRQRMLKYG